MPETAADQNTTKLRREWLTAGEGWRGLNPNPEIMVWEAREMLAGLKAGAPVTSECLAEVFEQLLARIKSQELDRSSEIGALETKILELEEEQNGSVSQDEFDEVKDQFKDFIVSINQTRKVQVQLLGEIEAEVTMSEKLKAKMTSAIEDLKPFDHHEYVDTW